MIVFHHFENYVTLVVDEQCSLQTISVKKKKKNIVRVCSFAAVLLCYEMYAKADEKKAINNNKRCENAMKITSETQKRSIFTIQSAHEVMRDMRTHPQC